MKSNDKHIENCSSKTWVTLTVSESKRLIAKGLLNYTPVKERMNDGSIIVTKGTTNAYIAEELLDIKLKSGAFVYGHILPKLSLQKVDSSETLPEIVLVNGKPQKIDCVIAFNEMKEGDIILKGANIINYDKQQAGVLILHPTGGTCGNIVPVIEEKKLHLIIPVSLEKNSSQDIKALSADSKKERRTVGNQTPYVWHLKGDLFTEIEALKQFADVDVKQIASGGIGGAEGAVSLLISGNENEVKRALDIIDNIQGEPAYL